MKTKLLFGFILFAFQFAVAKELLFVDPVAPSVTNLSYCDPNNDGFGVFDLTVQNASILAAQTGAASDYMISYHESFTDAQVGGTGFVNPSAYYNISSGSQMIYYRVRDVNTNAYAVGSFQLVVNPRPVATTPSDYHLCDNTGVVGYENFDLTTIIPEVLGTIDPSSGSVTFYASQSDADNGINQITNIGSYVNATLWQQTLYVRVADVSTGCYDVVPLHLVVDPLPQSIQPNYPEYILCDATGLIGYESFDLSSRITSILLGQTGMDVTFYPSLADAQNGTNQISNSSSFVNTIIYVQTLGIRITNQVTGCYVISAMDIRVEPLPNLVPPSAPYTICDDNQDGFGSFDLTTLIPGLLNGGSYSITFHETLNDAETDGTTIPLPSSYSIINPFTQTIYVRGEDSLTGCYIVLPIVLQINSAPIVDSLAAIQVCDADANPLNGMTSIDLTQQTAVILASQPLAASNYTVTFYINQISAEAATLPILPTTNYLGSDGQTIWYRVENNSTNCYNVGSFQLVINSPLALTTPTPLKVCDNDANPNDQHTTFNLTVKNNEITQGLTGYAVTYYTSLADAQANVNAIFNPTAYINVQPAVQTLGVRVTSPAGCGSLTTLDIRVYPIPTPNTNPPPLTPQCDINNPGDMMEMFDFRVNAAYIMNGDPNLVLHYFRIIMDALSNQNELLPAAELLGSSVWIRVENTMTDYQGNHCYVLVEQPLTVYPLPTIVQPLPPYRVCDDNADGIAQFDLTNPLLAQMILGSSQLPTGFTISYYLTAANAVSGTSPLPSTYTNVVLPQNIYIRVVNNTTGCVNATGQLTLAVEAHATATGPQSFSTCDNYGDPYDGVGLINLTAYAPAILNGQNPAIFLLSYYTSLADAAAGTNALTFAQATAYQNDADTDTIWVKVENSNNAITPLCYAITTININVERYPNPFISTENGFNTVYVDASNNVVQTLLLNAIPSGNYTYQWYLNGSLIIGATNSTYLVNTATPNSESRSYSVRAQNNGSLGCYTMSSNYLVLQSNSVPPPMGVTSQSFPSGATLANIVVSGTNIQWYASANGKMMTVANSTPLPLNTVLVDGTTYYASQTVGGIESIDRLPVTVHLALGVDENDIFPIQYAPNPVKNSLTLQSTSILKLVMVYTMLGQKVFEQDCNNTNVIIDLSRLSAGNYILKAQGETGQKTIRIIKE